MEQKGFKLWVLKTAFTGGPLNGEWTPFSYQNITDNNTGDFGIPTDSFNMLLNDATSSWDQERVLASNSDGQAAAQRGLAGVVARLQGFNGTTWDRLVSQANNADALAAVTLGILKSAAYNYVFNGATFDRVRGANVFKSVNVTGTGDTTIWTPTSGKKFRLMGGTISGSGSAASLVANLLKLQDGAAGANIVQFFLGVDTTVKGDTQIPFVVGGNGYLSGAINTVLNANLATAMATGGIIVNVYGTEE